jgi:hypothetical protein
VNGTGACGISITRSAAGEPPPGLCWSNIIAGTGKDASYDDPERYCAQCPLALHACPEDFRVGRNIFYDNRRAATSTREGAGGGAAAEDVDCPGEDLPREEFLEEIAQMVHSLDETQSPALLSSRSLEEWRDEIPPITH